MKRTKKTAVFGKDLPWPVMTREAILAACREGVCPFCDRDALKVIGLHFLQRHGVSSDVVREHYGFKYRQSFSTPQHSARMAAACRQRLADRPDLAAGFAAARKLNKHAPVRRRPQTIETLRRRGPEFADALLRYRASHPEEMAAHQRRAIAAAQARYAELRDDQDWLDERLRRYPLEQRREMVSRWQAGVSLAELARLFDANERSISDILIEQGVAGEGDRRQRYHHYRFSAAQEEEIVCRRAAGERADQIARDFGCSTTFVYYLARRARSELVPRELELLRLLATPASQEEIAKQLHLAPKTVVYYLTTIYHKLGVEGRIEAVAKARELQLIKQES